MRPIPQALSVRHSVFRRTRLVAVIAASLLLSAIATTDAVAQTTKIQPGASIINESGGQCTLNWVYDGTDALAGIGRTSPSAPRGSSS